MSELLFKPVSSLIKLTKTAHEALTRLKIRSTSDLLLHKPHSYIDRDLKPNLSNLQPQQHIVTDVIIKDIEMPKNRKPMKIYVENNTGSITLVFFNKIHPYIFSKLRIGTKITIEGKVEFNDFYYQIAHPEFIWNPQTKKELEPIYPLTYGLNNKQLHDYILRAILLIDNLPMNASGEYGENFVKAMKMIHSPNNHEEISRATAFLAEVELLSNQLMLAKARKENNARRGISFPKAENLQNAALQKIGFTLSNGQRHVIDEIEEDQSSSTRMTRMLQGDVGSGKTLVALLTILNVAAKNMQSALMAPTDLLASQHYNFFTKALDGSGIEVALLTSKTKAKQKKEILEKLEAGEILILIGTHSLFQNKVQFNDLGYIIIDEQHKFGVEQRAELLKKAKCPDMLVMTATPIPRSLTMTLFGDMSVSKLTSKPSCRPEIITLLKHSSKSVEIIKSIKRKMDCGERVYWICPLIEQQSEEESLEGRLEAADSISRFLYFKEVFGDKVGLVHGKMQSDEKDSTMQKFKNGEISMLVSTTVVEVGIDVPEATIIVIENAERFGLAQLHQLRGRVGRGSLSSFCILIYAAASSIARERLNIMKSSTDGFFIAEQDLLLRGGGEILGTKQSGAQEFHFADISHNVNLLVRCNEKANNIIKECIIDKSLEFISRIFTQNLENDRIF
ncbi:MAG: ATP-dependent DNA helicase RecG [Rickettsiaceae bacterium]|nr:ATP-dependent DNA helicase RecG [Rickettsiaceae bacterium]